MLATIKSSPQNVSPLPSKFVGHKKCLPQKNVDPWILSNQYSLQEFDDYLNTTMASSLKRSHIELDNEKSMIRRWVTGALQVMQSWDQPKRMQNMKVLKSEKLSTLSKWALAIVPVAEFQILNCVTAKQVLFTTN